MTIRGSVASYPVNVVGHSPEGQPPVSRDPEEDMKLTEQMLEHSQWLSSLARHLVRDPEEADDLVQDTWAAALRNGPRDEACYRSWLGRVLRNTAILSFRRRSRRQVRERLAAVKESVAGPEESVQKLEILRQIVDLVLSLDEACRDVVVLRYFEGLSGTEIARRLDLKPSAVRMRLKRALDQLRSELDRKHDGDRSAWQAGLAILAPGLSTPSPGSPPPAHSPFGSGAAATAGFVSGAAMALALGVVFAGGWARRDAASDSVDADEPPVVSEAREVDADIQELRAVLEETHTLLQSNADHLGSVHTRLAAIEEIVHRLLAGNPA